MSQELEDFISNHAEAFDDRVPDPAVLQRIQHQMAGAQAGDKKKGLVISMRLMRWAAACIVLLAGLGIVYMTENKKTETVTPTAAIIKKPSAGVAKENKTSPDVSTEAIASTTRNNSAEDLSQRAMETQKQVLFARLNDMSSPSTRVLGATEAYKMKNTDKDIVDALVNTMDNDPNTNVRLAALDALNRFHHEPYVKQQLVRSLKKQNDPMVQIQLIQLLTHMRETSIVHQLEKMVKDDNTIDAVKDDAYAGILSLKS